MKILFLPVNVASMQAITAQAMNQIDGVEAKCFTFQDHIYLTKNENTYYFPRTYSWKNPIKLIKTKIQYRRKLKEFIDWADILHYVGCPGLKSYRDLKWIVNSNKKVFIEFVGSEIRNPDLLLNLNPYYTKVFHEGYEYKLQESGNNKKIVQLKFSEIGAKVLANPEMKLYVDNNLLPEIFSFNNRINVRDFVPKFPSKLNNKPLIVHSPSAPIAKGSQIIASIIDKLKMRFEFDFIMLHNKPRTEVLDIMKKCDIFIDQIICGSFGMAALEAMANGKPTLCYIMDEVYDNGLPRDCPIVNVNPDTLEEKIIELICNSELRHEIGIQSRNYVEKFHDVKVLVKDLLKIYRS
jgi:glycosyltransferase involved in cell wall biosynthesis